MILRRGLYGLAVVHCRSPFAMTCPQPVQRLLYALVARDILTGGRGGTEGRRKKTPAHRGAGAEAPVAATVGLLIQKARR